MLLSADAAQPAAAQAPSAGLPYPVLGVCVPYHIPICAQGLSVPSYFTEYTEKTGHGPVNTGSAPFNNIANSVFSTAPAVSLIVTLFLDNTIPGTQVTQPPGPASLIGAQAGP